MNRSFTPLAYSHVTSQRSSVRKMPSLRHAAGSRIADRAGVIALVAPLGEPQLVDAAAGNEAQRGLGTMVSAKAGARSTVYGTMGDGPCQASKSRSAGTGTSTADP